MHSRRDPARSALPTYLRVTVVEPVGVSASDPFVTWYCALRRRWWAVEDSNLRRCTPTDLQSVPVGRLGNRP